MLLLENGKFGPTRKTVNKRRGKIENWKGSLSNFLSLVTFFVSFSVQNVTNKNDERDKKTFQKTKFGKSRLNVLLACFSCKLQSSARQTKSRSGESGAITLSIIWVQRNLPSRAHLQLWASGWTTSFFFFAGRAAARRAFQSVNKRWCYTPIWTGAPHKAGASEDKGKISPFLESCCPRSPTVLSRFFENWKNSNFCSDNFFAGMVLFGWERTFLCKFCQRNIPMPWVICYASFWLAQTKKVVVCLFFEFISAVEEQQESYLNGCELPPEVVASKETYFCLKSTLVLFCVFWQK